MPKSKVVPSGDAVLNIEGVAAMLGVGTRVAYRLAGEGKMPAVRLGDVWRFSRPAVEEWLRNEGLKNIK